MKRWTGAGELSRKLLTTLMITAFMSTTSMAQTLINQGTYDSKSLVDTNSTTTSTSTINTNNVNSGTVTTNNNTALSGGTTNTNNNVNVNSGTMTNNNNNNNSGFNSDDDEEGEEEKICKVISVTELQTSKNITLQDRLVFRFVPDDIVDATGEDIQSAGCSDMINCDWVKWLP